MKPLAIRGIRSSHLINPLHMEFTTDRVNLFQKYGPDVLKIRPQFDDFQRWAGREDISYKWLTKSFSTEQKMTADGARIETLIGFRKGVEFSLRSFDTAVVDAAKRVKILFNTYNKPVPMRRMSYDAKTAAITNLLQELNGAYAPYITLMGLGNWLTKLEEQNQAFSELTVQYNVEQANRPAYNHKESRKGVDLAYKDIVKRITAWIEIESETDWRPFVNELNALITHYHDILAQHLGRVHGKKQIMEDE